jgi:hypothetical protein
VDLHSKHFKRNTNTDFVKIFYECIFHLTIVDDRETNGGTVTCNNSVHGSVNALHNPHHYRYTCLLIAYLTTLLAQTKRTINE